VPQTMAPAALNLGFLTVLHEANGYLGGYLVTNSWGRPIEFRLTTLVQPNRVQQILYGGTLQPFICADLIGKTLVDKTGTPVQVLLTDREVVLELRQSVAMPVACIAPAGDPSTSAGIDAACVVLPASSDQGPVFCHPRYTGDVPFLRQSLEKLAGNLDLAEPFARIREALGEARKMGVTVRG
jgi:hypothetical protein